MGYLRRSSPWTACFIFLVTIILACAGGTVAYGQSSGSTTASITGLAKDQEGAVIPGVLITAKNTATGLTRSATTDEDGAYSISLLPPGSYDVSAEATGFATQVLRNVKLTIGQTAELNFSLQAGQIAETIEVVGEAPLIEPNRTQASTTIDQQRIENLPINRRNFLDFTLTTSAVTVDRMPAQGAAATSGLSFNGQSARQNNITIDGIDNNDYGSSSVRSTFSQEAVQEFQVVNNSYSAEFGRAIGGIINIVTRGGTNGLHGTTFLFVRNDALNARNAFAKTVPPFKQYQFGGTPLPLQENGRFIVTLDRFRASANARQIQLGFRFQF
ncbi:MAG: carboxypeptidase regulatory-like domain-containing protein [Acidobacteria bacterium]|nr:carboxypeptidase regulatory-like domain-containing protein [Acidobacteriota bacterium]